MNNSIFYHKEDKFEISEPLFSEKQMECSFLVDFFKNNDKKKG